MVKRLLTGARCSSSENKACWYFSNNVEYRRMQHIWVSNGIICRREDVRKTAQQIDLEGVALKKRRRFHC